MFVLHSITVDTQRTILMSIIINKLYIDKFKLKQ